MAVRLTMELSTIPELEAGVMGLALVGRAQMLDPANHGIFPRSLYDSGIRYQREEPAEEQWQTPLQTARRGVGDCEDLAAYRVSELLVQGESGARPRVLTISPTLRHVVVARADGRLEDPSKMLGMKGRG
jgi:hypothetical protein